MGDFEKVDEVLDLILREGQENPLWRLYWALEELTDRGYWLKRRSEDWRWDSPLAQQAAEAAEAKGALKAHLQAISSIVMRARMAKLEHPDSERMPLYGKYQTMGLRPQRG